MLPPAAAFACRTSGTTCNEDEPSQPYADLTTRDGAMLFLHDSRVVEC
jgi:hypothetical protein